EGFGDAQVPFLGSGGSSTRPPHCMDACDNNGPRRSGIPQEAPHVPVRSRPRPPPHRHRGGPLEVPRLHVGPYENNAYLLRDPETNDALLVDAANEAERLLELLGGIRLVGIVTTHRHPHHIQALAGVLKAHDVWNGAHPADADAIAEL